VPGCVVIIVVVVVVAGASALTYINALDPCPAASVTTISIIWSPGLHPAVSIMCVMAVVSLCSRTCSTTVFPSIIIFSFGSLGLGSGL